MPEPRNLVMMQEYLKLFLILLWWLLWRPRVALAFKFMLKKLLFNSLFPIANVQLREDGVIRFDNKAQVDQPYLFTQFEHGGFTQTKPRREAARGEHIYLGESPTVSCPELGQPRLWAGEGGVDITLHFSSPHLRLPWLTSIAGQIFRKIRWSSDRLSPHNHRKELNCQVSG